MSSELKLVLAGCDLRTTKGARVASIRDRETDLGVDFPSEYVDLMLFSNGIDGSLSTGDSVVIDPIEEMMDDEMQLRRAAWSGLIVFGSDGAGEAFAFDANNEMRIVAIPFVGDRRDAIEQAGTLTDFLATGPIFRRS